MSIFEIFTDGSIHPEERRAGWAYYAESDDCAAAHSGFIENCKDVGTAEFRAVVSGLGFAAVFSWARLQQGVAFVVWTDSLEVVAWRNQIGKCKREKFNDCIERMIEIEKLIGVGGGSIEIRLMTPEQKHRSVEHQLCHNLARKAARHGRGKTGNLYP